MIKDGISPAITAKDCLNKHRPKQTYAQVINGRYLHNKISKQPLQLIWSDLKFGRHFLKKTNK